MGRTEPVGRWSARSDRRTGAEIDRGDVGAEVLEAPSQPCAPGPAARPRRPGRCPTSRRTGSAAPPGPSVGGAVPRFLPAGDRTYARAMGADHAPTDAGHADAPARGRPIRSDCNGSSTRRTVSTSGRWASSERAGSAPTGSGSSSRSWPASGPAPCRRSTASRRSTRRSPTSATRCSDRAWSSASRPCGGRGRGTVRRGHRRSGRGQAPFVADPLRRGRPRALPSSGTRSGSASAAGPTSARWSCSPLTARPDRRSLRPWRRSRPFGWRRCRPRR